MFEFEKATPESIGLGSESINSFLLRLKKHQIAMHSVLMMRHNKLFFEAYYAPYNKDTLHRMFSITKSFTAVAIGLLIDEGKLTLDDKIIQYFPDMLPENVHPWLEKLTIRNMLMMRTCHANATYVINQTENWTKSFFTEKPSLPPDTLFHYDTSSAQVLCSLVERLTGMTLWDYIRLKLSALDFSNDSYALKEPAGFSIGGSGLMATPLDLMKFGYFLSNKGCVNGKQLLSKDFIELATSRLSDTTMNAAVPEETNGYGMQIWSYERGGYMCYGMGGQFVIVLPKEDIILVTTADTQYIQGGNQQIHDAFVEEIVEKLSDAALTESSDSIDALKETVSKLRVEPLKKGVVPDSNVVKKLADAVYSIEPNNYGFDNFKFKIKDNAGEVSYTLNGKEFTHPFGFGENIESIFPKYQMHTSASAKWGTPNTLYLRLNILDVWLGTVHMEFVFNENDIWIEMRKIEETIFQEYNNCLYGHIK